MGDRYLKMRERLFEQLSLSDAEKVFIQRHHKTDLTVRRVALLINNYLNTDDRSGREGLLRLLLDEAVPGLRAVMEARELVVPDGHCVVTVQRLQALRELATLSILASKAQGSDKYDAVRCMSDACDAVMHLDPEVAAAVEPQRTEEVSHG